VTLSIKVQREDKLSKSSKLLWDTIVRVTQTVGSEEAEGIRVPLYMFLASERIPPLRDKLRSWRRVWDLLITPIGRQVSKKPPRHCPLFVFIYNTPSNMNNILPVFEAAQRRAWTPSVLLGAGFLASPKHFEGVTSITKYSEMVAFTTAKERLEALSRAWSTYDTLLSEFERASQHLAQGVQHHRLQLIIELMLFSIISAGLRRFYSALGPSCVISTSDFWPFESAVFLEARRLGIPSFVIQHGTTTPLWWPFVADKLLLWGEPFRDEIIGLGAPPDRLMVCGMPATDSIFSKYMRKSDLSQRMPKSCM